MLFGVSLEGSTLREDGGANEKKFTEESYGTADRPPAAVNTTAAER
jgi:hypothetical protein